MAKSKKISIFQILIRVPMAFTLTFHMPFAHASSEVPVEPQISGQAFPNLKTPAGNDIFQMGMDTQGKPRIMAFEYGQIVEGTLENGRPIWDSELPNKVETADDRPSRWRDRLKWNSESTAEANKEIDRLQSGRTSPTSSLGQKAKGGASYLGQGAAFFFIALGMVAAVNVILFHSNNPMALANYTRTLTDPVGWLSLFGFMIVAYPFFRSASLPKNQTPLRFFPRFAGGLLVGGLVSSVIMEMGQDPFVRACMNLDKVGAIAKGEKPARNELACDMAYARWTTPSVIAEKMAPAMANLLVAGSLYYGVLKGSRFLVNKWSLPARLQAMRVMKPGSLRGGGIGSTILFNLGHLMLFMGAFEFTKRVLGIENWIREQIATRFSLQTNEFGNTIQASLNNLNFMLNQLEADKFKDPQLIIRLYAVQTNLAAQLFSWRALQMEPVKRAADEWGAKLNQFQTIFNKSYQLYEDIINRIAYERSNPNLSEEDDKRITWNYLLNDVLKTPEAGYAGPFSDPGDWEFVSTKNLMEYVVASMACGPEVEFEKSVTRRFWFKPAPTKQSVINDPLGFAASFKPPQITSFTQSPSVCDQSFTGGSQKLPPQSIPVMAQMIDGDGKAKNIQEKNLLEFIRKNIRPSVLGPDHQSKFDDWWKAHVLSQLKPAYDQYELEYTKILNGPLRAAFTRTDYKCLGGVDLAAVGGNNSPVLNGSFAREDKCGKGVKRSLAYGVVDSLQDEATLYISVLKALPRHGFTVDRESRYLKVISTLEEKIRKDLSDLRDMKGQEIDPLKIKNDFLELEKQAMETLPQIPSVNLPVFLGSAGTEGLVSNFSAANLATKHQEKVTEEFLKQNPQLALVQSNFRHLSSLLEQVRLFYTYSRFPDRSGPAFIAK